MCQMMAMDIRFHDQGNIHITFLYVPSFLLLSRWLHNPSENIYSIWLHLAVCQQTALMDSSSLYPPCSNSPIQGEGQVEEKLVKFPIPRTSVHRAVQLPGQKGKKMKSL